MPLMIDPRVLVASDDDVSVKDDRATAPGRLLDLMVLILAIDAYQLAGDNQDHLNRGLTIYRQHRGSIEEAAKKHIEGLLDRNDAAAIKTKFRLMESIDPAKKARFVEEFLIWVRHRSTLMRDVFPGRAYAAACKAAAACEQSDLESRLQQLSLVPTSSGMSAMFKWVRKSAEEVGSPPPTTEAIAAQVEGAAGIAEDLKNVTSQLAAEAPDSPKRAELEDKKLDFAADLNEAIQESDDPPTVLAQAAQNLSKGSKIAEKFGLTSEQEQVMLCKGKVVVAAGAGSGKTQTLVATIAHLVEDDGYQPSQILSCSFTRAASAELEHRVETRAGIQGCRIGTTHSIARDIIKRARPDLAYAVANTKGADRLFKMAMKQVSLSAEAFQKTLDESKGMMERIEKIPGWANKDILRSFHDQVGRGRTLSEKQVAVLEKFEGGGGGWGARRRFATEEEELYASAIEEVMAIQASEKQVAEAKAIEAAWKPGKKDEVSKFWTVPVGQWFNLGKPIDEGEKKAKLAVENFKNSGISLEQARQEKGDQDPMVALYGAYEWLKQNDPVEAPALDYTDQLILGLEILRTNTAARESEQRRYKAILVDEAQDLNQVQFEMFQILGQKADLLAFIGDDKQSIYAFRGAKPSNYVGLSREDEFQTKLLTMNFRSGKAIVDAANKLIAHNEDRQIPMVCEADVDRKGIGAIKAKSVRSHEDGADQVAQEIKDACDAGDSPKDFGILVRNNAEAHAYTLSLLVRGIPYRMLKKSEGGYFGQPLVRALTAWMRLVIGGDTAIVNDAVVEAHMTPGFGLDKQFVAGLSSNASNYLDFILGGGDVYFGNSYWMNKRVREYADAIRQVRILGQMDSESLIRAILSVKGTKGTFEEALMRLVNEDDVAEDGAEVTEEAIRDTAMAPLRPLMKMAENFHDPANLLTFIKKMKDANEKTQKATPESKEDWKEPAVLVGTVHGWKGLQAKHCYVVMTGGVFPHHTTEQSPDPNAFDEERRLAYVAITRGEDSVTVVSASQNYKGREAPMSRFIGESCIPVSGEDTVAAPNEESLVRADPLQIDNEAEEEVLRMEREMSAGKKSNRKTSSFGESMAVWAHGCGHMAQDPAFFDEFPEDEGLPNHAPEAEHTPGSCGCH